ncbi:MAG: copper chaperone CopZ [Gammaproteobacteria bacterium]|jgi:copper chaperone CopZ
MFKKYTTISLLYVLLTTPVLAQNYVVNVHGIVCELCSYGVAKNIRKLQFIDSSQYDNGVKVDIENQMVFVAVRNDADLDKQVLFNAIESGGYKPVQIWALSASGEKVEIE